MNAKVIGIFILLIVLCVFMVFWTSNPWYNPTTSDFLGGNNIENLLRRTALYGVLGIGVAFVIITGGIDLSVGSVVCLSACLLAMFLNVDYQPFDRHEVLAVRASDRTIYLPGQTDAFQAGDQIRYEGGRKAHSNSFTVSSVSHAKFDGAEATALKIDNAPNSDDTTGHVAKLHKVAEFDAAKRHTITLAGRHEQLAAKDQIALFDPVSGRSVNRLETVSFQDNQTVITIKNALGANFTNQWQAIPLERRQRMPIPAAILLVLCIAGGLGLVHGLLITKLRLQPFVVTLCGLLIYRGVSRWLTNDQPQGFGVDEYTNSVQLLAKGKLTIIPPSAGFEGFGIPYPFLILIVLAVVAAIFLNKTIWGRYMLALGRNEEAARYSGINTGRVTIVAYVICTMLAAVGGMLFGLDVPSISPSQFGNFYELYAIAAAVLGGCSLRGGEGSIFGVAIGTALMQVLRNLIVMIGIAQQLEYAVIGAVILLGVMGDELIRRLVAKRRAAAQTDMLESSK